MTTLFSSPLETIALIGALLVSISWHEAAHGLVAYWLGDDTPKLSGRLTLNPMAHIDPIGTVLVPLGLMLLGLPVFGWARPVPINPANFANEAFDGIKVAIAGPISNLIIALAFGLSLRLGGAAVTAPVANALTFITEINILLAVFNLLPIPPLDGSRLLRVVLPFETYLFFERFGFMILVAILLLGGPIITTVVGSITSTLFQLITGNTLAF